MYRQKLQTFILFCLFCVGFYSCASPNLEQDFKEKFQPTKVKIPRIKPVVNFIGLSPIAQKELTSYTNLFRDNYTERGYLDSANYGYAIWRLKQVKTVYRDYNLTIYALYLPMIFGAPSGSACTEFKLEFEILDSKREVVFQSSCPIFTQAYKAAYYGYTYDDTFQESFIRALLQANTAIIQKLEPSLPKLKTMLLNSGAIN